MLAYEAELRRQRKAKADLIEAVCSGYSGAQSEKAGQLMQNLLDVLRGPGVH